MSVGLINHLEMNTSLGPVRQLGNDGTNRNHAKPSNML